MPARKPYQKILSRPNESAEVCFKSQSSRSRTQSEAVIVCRITKSDKIGLSVRLVISKSATLVKRMLPVDRSARALGIGVANSPKAATTRFPGAALVGEPRGAGLA